jgi:ABC-type Fe3+-hydroxamate transport system substrate-binding protein
MPETVFTDQLGHTITLTHPPGRIISLVPSQTEVLADLGLEQEVVGITKFCVHPSRWRKTKTIIGGTKNIRMDCVESLQPDLIIGNKEENDRASIEALRARYPVWMSDIVTVENALQMIAQLGALTGKAEAAGQLVHTIQVSMKSLPVSSVRSALYLIWHKPWMGAGNDTFINTMLMQAGFSNCLSAMSRYPVLDDNAIRQLNPEIIFLSSEPFPFRQSHMEELRQLLPETSILLVDGELFSWYGSRMRYFADYIRELRMQLP